MGEWLANSSAGSGIGVKVCSAVDRFFNPEPASLLRAVTPRTQRLPDLSIWFFKPETAPGRFAQQPRVLIRPR